jgi:predicted nuclease of predicted toxin-antitoxin system
MADRLFIDECLTSGLVAVAKDRGVVADHCAHISKSGWSDWRIVSFALDNDYVVATNNRRHFLRQYARLSLHNGLIVIVPSVDLPTQVRLFAAALDKALDMGADLINKLVEVLADGSVHVREWTSEAHDIGHLGNPRWP